MRKVGFWRIFWCKYVTGNITIPPGQTLVIKKQFPIKNLSIGYKGTVIIPHGGYLSLGGTLTFFPGAEGEDFIAMAPFVLSKKEGRSLEDIGKIIDKFVWGIHDR